MKEQINSVINIQPPAIGCGAFHAYFIYDVGDTIDLSKLGQIAGRSIERVQLQLRSIAAPDYMQFLVPPLLANLPDTLIDGHFAQTRVKLYDYGIVSIRFSFPFTGLWNELSASTRALRESGLLTAASQDLLGSLMPEINAAVDEPHEPFMEDYFIYEVESFQEQISANELISKYSQPLTTMLLGESRPLTATEQDEALRMNFSYFPDDLTVIQWDSAFVFDRREGADAIENILELANSQLVELRIYDRRLDAELDEIYALDRTSLKHGWLLGQYAANQRAERLRYLLVDIRELSDRGSNTLKFIGDVFYARLYRGTAARLGLSDWQQQIDTKLESIREFSRFLTDQAQNARNEFLELVIIVLIAIEIIMNLDRAYH